MNTYSLFQQDGKESQVFFLSPCGKSFLLANVTFGHDWLSTIVEFPKQLPLKQVQRVVELITNELEDRENAEVRHGEKDADLD